MEIEFLIACHSPKRDLQRAVRSILEDNAGGTSATIIAHNVPVEDLAANLSSHLAAQVKWLSLNDGIRSPGNPFNYGLNKASAPWVSLVGSDDYLQPGAVEHWRRMAPRSDAVITRLLHDNGSPVRTPPVRPLRRGNRDAAKDRLYYRSAPLGMLRREFLLQHDLTLDQGIRTGEDLRLSGLLWTEGRVRVQTTGPGYVIGSNASDRVTLAQNPLEEDLEPIRATWQGGWATKLNAAQRSALGTKYFRIHFFGAAYYRALAGEWLPGDRDALAQAAHLVTQRAPDCLRPLSRADRALADALADVTVPDEEVNRLALARRKFGRLDTLLPRDLRYLAHREAPPRFMVASALVR